LSSVLSQFTRLTVRRTDRILIARWRLYSMQSGINDYVPNDWCDSRLFMGLHERPFVQTFSSQTNIAKTCLSNIRFYCAVYYSGRN